MQLNSLISAIPSRIRPMKPQMTLECATTSIVYEHLIEKSNALMEKCIAWEEELCTEINYETFIRCFNDIYKVTNVAKDRSFQYRLLHRAIITNVHLARWGKCPDNLCTFCNETKETYVHLFIYCKYVEQLWIRCDEFMNKNLSKHTNIFWYCDCDNKQISYRPSQSTAKTLCA